MWKPFIPLLLTLVVATSAALANPISYSLEKDRSVVGFIWFFGEDAVRGTMPVAEADLVIDFDQIENSRVSVSVDVAGAKAGFPFADQAMKGKKVLWADRFPTIEFQSSSVRKSGSDAEIEGVLTIRGMARPVVFDAVLYRQRGTEIGDRDRMSILVTGTVSRSDFGATGWSDMVGDRVELKILARIRRSDT